MSSKKFWKLSLYEWSIWIQRILSLQEKRKQDQELLMELERNSMALFANAHRDQRQPPYSGKDFYRLSYDEVTEEVKITGEMMYKLMTDRFKNIPVRKRNG
jgi:hypothetical protein